MNKDKPITISLFAGAFGLDLGMEQAGFQTVNVVEIDPDAVKTIALNRPQLSECAVPRDIRQVSSQTLLEEAGRNLGIGSPLRAGEVQLTFMKVRQKDLIRYRKNRGFFGQLIDTLDGSDRQRQILLDGNLLAGQEALYNSSKIYNSLSGKFQRADVVDTVSLCWNFKANH